MMHDQTQIKSSENTIIFFHMQGILTTTKNSCSLYNVD